MSPRIIFSELDRGVKCLQIKMCLTFGRLSLCISFILVCLVGVEGNWHGEKLDNGTIMENGGELCIPLNGTTVLSNCSKPDNRTTTVNLRRLKGLFLPIFMPTSTIVVIVAIFIGLYIYLYQQEKQVQYDNEQNEQSSTDDFNGEAATDSHTERQWVRNVDYVTKQIDWDYAPGEDIGCQEPPGRTVKFAKYPQFRVPSFSLNGSIVTTIGSGRNIYPGTAYPQPTEYFN